MSNRPTYSEDDPVIGFAPDPVAQGYDGSPMIGDGAAPLPEPESFAPETTQYATAPYYPEDDLEPYYDEYVHESPAQSPWFYAFLVAAALVGAVVVFAIVRSIDTGGDDDDEATPAAAQILQVQLASPREGDRIIAGEEATFGATVASSQPITKVELLINGAVFAEGSAQEAQSQPQGTASAQAKLYDAIVKARFANRGEFQAALRITSGGETMDTQPVRIVVVQAPEDPRVEARVIATTSVRTGPGDTFPEVERLEPGSTVLVSARTEDSEWLMIEDESAGEHWIRRNAVQDSASLVSVPVRSTVATPPAQTPTPEVEETPAPTPIGGPDFAPADARFVYIEGGRAALRVTIVNNGSDFSGPLVVEAATSAGSLAGSQVVFDFTLRSGGAASVDFEFAGAMPDRADVTVIVDPGNAVSESNEDNNTAGFGVSAPADPPEVVISSVSVSGSTVTVVVANIGGTLPPGDITVVVSVGGSQQSQSIAGGLASDETATFVIEAPGTGTGTVSVLINGATAASAPVEISSAEPTETATATATEAATETATMTETPTDA